MWILAWVSLLGNNPNLVCACLQLISWLLHSNSQCGILGFAGKMQNFGVKPSPQISYEKSLWVQPNPQIRYTYKVTLSPNFVSIAVHTSVVSILPFFLLKCKWSEISPCKSTSIWKKLIILRFFAFCERYWNVYEIMSLSDNFSLWIVNTD